MAVFFYNKKKYRIHHKGKFFYPPQRERERERERDTHRESASIIMDPILCCENFNNEKKNPLGQQSADG